MKSSDLFVKALEHEGVKYIFGIPGEENLDLLNSIKDSSIKLVLTRHEQAAGFMAATYGRLTKTPGVCLSTLGPGATNFVTSAAYAQLAAMPLVMITGQKPIRKSKQGRFQIVDVVSLMKPITKYAIQVADGNNIGPIIAEAFRIATDERPGAVLIELPEDIAATQTSNNIIDVVKYHRPNADERSIEEATALIENAKMPLLLIGAGANRKAVGNLLTEFINKTNIFFCNTQMGKGVVDERHNCFIGTAALSSDDFVHYAIDKADLIINVGHDVIEKPPFFMDKNQKTVIHINFFQAQIDNVYFPQLNVVGDIGRSVAAITKKIKQTSICWDFSYFKKVKDHVDIHLTKYFKDDRFPILPQRAVNIVRENLGSDTILTLDNGMYKIWFARNYKCYKPNTLLLDNALATMGAGLPSAIAAKIVNPKKQVVCVCGDGGFMMNSQELETAVRLKLDLTIIILNDNAFGMIKWKQEGMGFSNYGLDYNNPDFLMYASSYGAVGYRPTSCEEFITHLKESLNTKGVKLIDLGIDYSLNHAILNILLKEKEDLDT